MQTCYAFGKWLRSCRSERGISLRELGRIAGANYSYIARLEHGAHAAPSRGMVIRLAQALGAPRAEALLAAGYAPYLEESATPRQCLAGLVGERCGKLQKDQRRGCADGGQAT
jgi:transcriptional regulator with XRE-family HTH domain